MSDETDMDIAAILQVLNSNRNKMVCNLTCCEVETDQYFCSAEHNYSQFYNSTGDPSYELGIRWSFTIVVFLMGIIGNLVIIHILLKNRLLLKSSVNNFILNMSVADLILACCGPIPFTIRDTNVFWILGGFWCHMEGYMQEMVMMVSVLSLCVISFDRMMGVAFPFREHMTGRHARFGMAFIWVISALLAIPFAVYRVYTKRLWADTLETICRETGSMSVWWPVSMAVLVWIPLIIMTFCYSIIFIHFRRNGTTSEEPESTTMTKRRVVYMMFVVVMVFVTCWGPLEIFTISKKSFLQEDGTLQEDKTIAYETFLSVSNYMVYLNPALNPIIYGLMHDNFQKAFRITYSCLYKKKPNLVLSRSMNNRGFVFNTRHINIAERLNVTRQIRTVTATTTSNSNDNKVTGSNNITTGNRATSNVKGSGIRSALFWRSLGSRTGSDSLNPSLNRVSVRTMDDTAKHFPSLPGSSGGDPAFGCADQFLPAIFKKAAYEDSSSLSSSGCDENTYCKVTAGNATSKGSSNSFFKFSHNSFLKGQKGNVNTSQKTDSIS